MYVVNRWKATDNANLDHNKQNIKMDFWLKFDYYGFGLNSDAK